MRKGRLHGPGDFGLRHQRIDWPVAFQSFTN
jgi:hypothetical protein